MVLAVLLVKQRNLLAVLVVVMQAKLRQRPVSVNVKIVVTPQKQHVVRVPLTLAKLVIQHVLIRVTITAVPRMFTKIQLAQVWPIARTSVAMI